MQLFSRTQKKRPNCSRELMDAVPPLFWYIRRHMREHRKGLSVPQFRALVKIRNEPATSLSAVAEHLGSTLPTASRTISKLVARGFLSRCGSPKDRRQCALTLTPRGRQLVEGAMAATQAKMEADLAELSRREQTVVREAMGLLRGVFEGVRDKELINHVVAATMPRPRVMRPVARTQAVPAFN